MAGVLDSVNQRTQLVGENRLELLMFNLNGRQTFAINVFKIQEVLKLSGLTQMPHEHPAVCGVTHLRGRTVPIINLSMAIKMPPLTPTSDSTIIVTEYNRTIQGFLIGGVDRIVNMNWGDILPPPKGAGRNHYLTAITRYEDKLVEIIDVEKVLAEIVPYNTDISDDVLDHNVLAHATGKRVLIVDDSPVAMGQAKSTVEKLGLEVVCATNGLEAHNILKGWAEKGEGEINKLLMIITDAEMPEMDGYMLTTAIRQDERLKHLHVVLHTSLSGSFNKAMVKKVGCDGFLSKFQPDELAGVVQQRLKDVLG
ncbi:chemotaxis protein CheV [Alkalimarinus sediminis]|uniref:Chemotaxis protein CheV n=1 Tax=Alkalimarinus sediminis TaxID=1632866 RepID=A0A9E8KQ15_9ALTE|nr:chemotaxis protein CheV [Alkalimarinus sediminis]UZW75908.1 chemotaxis protein CheV [Alkalimarinus sediminis]